MDGVPLLQTVGELSCLFQHTFKMYESGLKVVSARRVIGEFELPASFFLLTLSCSMVFEKK